MSNKQRNHIWYVTLDEVDYFQPGYTQHRRNLARLQEVAQKANIQVNPIWMNDLSEDHLQDESLLAIYGGGSYTEWFTAATNPVWGQQLDRYGHLIRNTTVPMLAVCGSHQFYVRVFMGWEAIGHMTPAGQPSPSICDEFLQNRSLVPQPRIGEVGDFPLQICPDQRDDPLLAGLPDQPWFVQYHRDFVLPGRYHPAFISLMEPTPDLAPRFHLADEPANGERRGHLNPHYFQERCQVQALRLNSTERVLYVTQFHPDISGLVDKSIDWQSERLLHNFFRIAAEYWESTADKRR